MTWRREGEGLAQRHRLEGTDLSVLAYGGRHVSGYGAGGRARLAGRERVFEVYEDERRISGWPRLKDAKAAAERRAS